MSKVIAKALRFINEDPESRNRGYILTEIYAEDGVVASHTEAIGLQMTARAREDIAKILHRVADGIENDAPEQRFKF